jgi:hypothetical protein
MAQRIFASANDASAPGGRAAPAAETPDTDPVELRERARAAAYLDLWEAQLAHAAAHGPPARLSDRLSDRPSNRPSDPSVRADRE